MDRQASSPSRRSRRMDCTLFCLKQRTTLEARSSELRVLCDRPAPLRTDVASLRFAQVSSVRERRTRLLQVRASCCQVQTRTLLTPLGSARPTGSSPPFPTSDSLLRSRTTSPSLNTSPTSSPTPNTSISHLAFAHLLGSSRSTVWRGVIW